MKTASRARDFNEQPTNHTHCADIHVIKRVPRGESEIVYESAVYILIISRSKTEIDFH